MSWIDTTTYEYQPETPIRREEYDWLVAAIDVAKEEDVGIEHSECVGGACPISFDTSRKVVTSMRLSHLLLASALIVWPVGVQAQPYNPLTTLLFLEAEVQGVSPRLVLGIAAVESEFRPWAESSAHAIGLMQVKCSTAREQGFSGNCEQLKDPWVNVVFGVAYLKRALAVAKGNECRATGLYNTGIYSHHPSVSYCRKVRRAKKRRSLRVADAEMSSLPLFVRKFLYRVMSLKTP